MISVHNWTKENDRSSYGKIIVNNWGNCRFENLASSALRGWNMSMLRRERWTEAKRDLNDNEQNTRLHFASTPEDRSAYLNNQPVHVLISHAWEKMNTFDLFIPSFSSFSAAWGFTSRPRSDKPLKHSGSCGKTVLECLHEIKCVNLALGMCEPQNESRSLSIYGPLSIWFNNPVQYKVTFVNVMAWIMHALSNFIWASRCV